MNELSKTITFVFVAAGMVGLAVANHYWNQPKTDAVFELVGKPFFEDFTSSSQANELEVAAIDKESLELKKFSVKNEDGLWRIPSHHNYPAEAASRLAQTATSVMGIERESLAGRMAADHERLGVLDPLDEDLEDPEAAGQRITINDNSGEPLVDLIIGNEAGEVQLTEADRRMFEGRQPDKYFYVRRADEQQTYKVKLDIDLSTKFADWIDPDLLQIEQTKLRRIGVDNYELTEEQANPLSPVMSLVKSQGDQINLARDSGEDSWNLAGLDEAKEQLVTAPIQDIINVLREIKIAGVRPKFKYKGHLLLTPDLKLNAQETFKDDLPGFQRAIAMLQQELSEKGFNLAGTTQEMGLVSQNGDVQAGTSDGILYTLQIGKQVEGEESDIEIGGREVIKDAESEPDKELDPKIVNDISKEEKNRFLMVRVSFDESLLGGRPVKPTPPTKPAQPEDYTPESNESDGGDANKNETEIIGDDEDEAPVPSADGDPTDNSNDDLDEDAASQPNADKTETPPRNPKFVNYDHELEDYKQASVEFELAASRFEQDEAAFEDKVKAGKALVKKLNERFGDWYYVVTASNLKSLQVTREELVTKKELPAELKDLPPKPNISYPETE